MQVQVGGGVMVRGGEAGAEIWRLCVGTEQSVGEGSVFLTEGTVYASALRTGHAACRENRKHMSGAGVEAARNKEARLERSKE